MPVPLARNLPAPLANYLRPCANCCIVCTCSTSAIWRQPGSGARRWRRALADPKRLCVLQSLADGELSVRELSDRVGCHVPNMSQHLAVLRNSGLVLTRRDGNAIYYRLADPRILEACRLLQSIAG